MLEHVLQMPIFMVSCFVDVVILIFISLLIARAVLKNGPFRYPKLPNHKELVQANLWGQICVYFDNNLREAGFLI
jgi:hypothetical protein